MTITRIVYGKMADGSWVKKTTIPHEGPITSATFSADQRHVVTTSKDKTVRVTKLLRSESKLP
ncbi:WD40 repeat domain-containing protein [Endozoicomonas sp. 8E]|uniref:WD40 repeat domain-containing protein n=1 Tax=Endozoicomonas sp. 8E TaxID=3035692 RepID=UPI002938E02C|nr:WD40 repeat domain-containing protein [Endozoicomonas sp. 8E]WOG25779.1 WD40 repeat domain-containing protein [Endozoicomonas sp. 8E]